MKVLKVLNQTYEGFNRRLSLLDVFYPEKVDHYPVVIFAHGFKGFKDWGVWDLLFEKIASEGFVVIKFNFSHNGGTRENPIDFPDLEAFARNTYSKELFDLKVIIDLVENKKLPGSTFMNPNEICLIGHSRGGGISILTAAKDERIKKLITWASVGDFFSRLPESDKMKSWKEEGTYYTENSRTKQLMPMNYEFVKDLEENKANLDIQQSAASLNVPWYIIHGEDDPVVLLNEAADLNKISKNSSLKIVKNANHVFGGKHPYAYKELPEHCLQLMKATLELLKS